MNHILAERMVSTGDAVEIAKQGLLVPLIEYAQFCQIALGYLDHQFNFIHRPLGLS